MVNMETGDRSPAVHCNINEYHRILELLQECDPEALDKMMILVLMDSQAGEMDFSTLPIIKATTLMSMKETPNV